MYVLTYVSGCPCIYIYIYSTCIFLSKAVNASRKGTSHPDVTCFPKSFASECCTTRLDTFSGFKCSSSACS